MPAPLRILNRPTLYRLCIDYFYTVFFCVYIVILFISTPKD
uniref:Uncharacterized protein n=1 Tax=Ackermannviridae sp. TaxID=2831612 RepID=A0A8S5VVQ7_9CAUD|nr:MAG TPA: hypothetical protein [Ackermannviridae sp.]